LIALTFGLQPDSPERIDSIEIPLAARIPVQMEFSVGTGTGNKAGVILAPMKLFLLVGVVYILVAYAHLNLTGVMIGL
jgi:hypothetical protein